MISTLTLGSIYEQQGLKDDALRVYKDILEKDPTNAEARRAIVRLAGGRRKFDGVNKEMKEFFCAMSTPQEMSEFERWMGRIWN